MSIAKTKKSELIGQYGKNEQDTGSAGAQVAIISERIKNLTEHFKTHKKDHHSKLGLMKLIGQRRRLLKFVKNKSTQNYTDLIKALGLKR